MPANGREPAPKEVHTMCVDVFLNDVWCVLCVVAGQLFLYCQDDDLSAFLPKVQSSQAGKVVFASASFKVQRQRLEPQRRKAVSWYVG